jgi:hypothetical protein
VKNKGLLAIGALLVSLLALVAVYRTRADSSEAASRVDRTKVSTIAPEKKSDQIPSSEHPSRQGTGGERGDPATPASKGPPLSVNLDRGDTTSIPYRTDLPHIPPTSRPELTVTGKESPEELRSKAIALTIQAIVQSIQQSDAGHRPALVHRLKNFKEEGAEALQREIDQTRDPIVRNGLVAVLEQVK